MVFGDYVILSQLHSDQGSNFESPFIQRLCDRLGIHKTRTTAYHPQGNGQTENANRTILSALAKTLARDEDWDLEAPIVAFYYNSSVHKATGHTPALLALGREVAIPVSVLFPPVNPSIYMQVQIIMRIN
jgi:transposase InsO family protein